MLIHTYNIPFSASIFPFKNRQGLILETDQGVGEAAPLPGWSQENLQDALLSIRSGIERPSVNFAIRCASIPFPTDFPKIEIAALALNRHDAEMAIQNGYRTIKIKVKNNSIHEAIDLIASSPKNIRWRIDANRSWNLEQTQQFFQSVDPKCIDYVEEPMKDWVDLPHPIALDETLLQADAAKWIRHCSVQALVLKPTLLGSRLDFLIEQARIFRKKIVFSSCFESVIALTHLAHLQSRYEPHVAAGIDTQRFFQHNFFSMPIQNSLLTNSKIPSMDRRWISHV